MAGSSSRIVGLSASLVGVAALVVAACGRDSPVEDAAPPTGAAVRVAYADHDDGFGELWFPDTVAGGPPAPVVVLIHGGFWREGFLLDLMDPLVPSLLAEGFAVWNIEYRRVGAGGGFPATFDDVAAAVDHLAALPGDLAARVDLERVAAVGHSAGGHLAAWSAGREVLGTGAPGADPDVVPSLVISQAGVLDLVGCADDGVGGTACPDLVGGDPTEVPDRYLVASPLEMLPIAARVVAIHGDLDTIVPPSQSTRYVDAAVASGTRARVDVVAGADHFSHLDPAGAAWQVALGELVAWRG